MPKFQPHQRVRVREEGGTRSSQPDGRFLGKEGTIEYGTGNLEGGTPTFYFVKFDNKQVMAISPDWIEPIHP